MKAGLSRRDFLRKWAVGAAAGLATTVPSCLGTGTARAAGNRGRRSDDQRDWYQRPVGLAVQIYVKLYPTVKVERHQHPVG